MRRRESIAGIFVVVMLTLGAAIMLHWRSVQARQGMTGDLNMLEFRQATPREVEDAEHTIHAQLNAFRSDDFQKASTYQSTMLRVSFESVQNFRTAITVHYPQFCTFDKVKFGTCMSDPGGTLLRIQVMLLSKQGVATHAMYFLHKENGIYRVSQVISDPEMFFGAHGPMRPVNTASHPMHPFPGDLPRPEPY